MKQTGLLALMVGTCVLAGSSSARAHIRMLSPAPRYPGDGYKSGPCGMGNDQRGSNVTVVPSGSRLRIQWEETINHPSHYRVSFDADGQDDFADPPEMQAYYSNDAVLADELADPGGTMELEVQLPDVACENCTLQLIQVMYDKAPYEVGGNDIYYQCADLVLRRDAPCEGGSLDDAGTCVIDMGSDAGTPVGPGVDAGVSPGGDGAGDGSSEGAGGSDDGSSSGATGGYGSGGGSGTPGPATTSGSTCAASPAMSAHGGPLGLLVGLALWVLRRRR